MPRRDRWSWTHLLNILPFLFIFQLHLTEKLATIDYVYLNSPVHGVSSMLNSATGTPLIASIGANAAAGYTTDDVPTCVGTCMIIVHIRREFYWHCNAQAIANDWLRYCTLGHYCAVAGGCLENGHEGFQKATRWSNSKKDKSHMSACTELQNNFKWQSVCYFHIKCKEKIKTTLVCKKSQLDAPEATKINYI